MAARTLFNKLWDDHEVDDLGDGFSLLHVDRHLVADPGSKALVHMHARGLRVAGQVEIAGNDAPPDWRRAEVLRQHLGALFPAISADQLSGGRVWMGRRPSTPDGLPCIGLASGCQGVVHAYGHGHVGLGSSARTGRLVAQLLQGATPDIDLAPFSPQRFAASAA